MMTRGKFIRFFVIPLVAVLVFWLGGYFFFKGSADWQEVKVLLATDPGVRSKVGDVREITVAPFPFMYRFSGDYVRATLRVTVTGSTGEHRTTIEVEKRGGAWSFVS